MLALKWHLTARPYQPPPGPHKAGRSPPPGGGETRRSPARPSIPRALHQRSLERRAIHFGAREVHPRDAARVADVVERIGIEDEEIGALARGETAGARQSEELRRAAGRRYDDRRRRHAGVRHQFEFLLLGVAEEMILKPGVGAEYD